MDNSGEHRLLRLIKFAPTFLVLFISFIIVIFIYFDSKKTYEEEKKAIETKFLSDSKDNIQAEVIRVYTYIRYLQANTEEYLKKSIKDRVYEAHEIATNIYETYKYTKSKDEIFELIKVALDKVRFNDGRGYFYIDDEFGNKRLLPIDKENEDKNYFEHLDEKGYSFVKTMVETIKNKTERYDEYYWQNPNTKKAAKKIAFYKYLEPFNVVIGTGEYIEDFEKVVQQQALEYISMIRFKDNGYLFVMENNGKLLSHINKDLIGKHYEENVILKDENNNTIDIVEFAKNNEGFYSYLQKNEDNITRKKISYIKSVYNWNWTIGAGFYEDEIINSIEKLQEKNDEKYSSYIKNITLIFAILIFGLLLISKYISKYLEKILKDYKKELEQNQSMLYQKTKMESMGEMIGNITHQWRQPLSIITTSASAMKIQKEMNILNDEIFLEYIAKINSSANHLSQTIDDFKDFFKPNREKSKFFIQDSFNKALNLISSQFNKQNINIIQDIDDINIFSYENQLIQVFINILNNSRDELIKKDYDRYIFIDVKKINQDIVISIKDNAGGISTESINRIFEAYFSTKSKSDGTGIGLYMTKDIIEKQLNGSIKAENISFKYENKNFTGADFIITLKA
ncbi:sensor histidine kinase [Aliarcobacter vitoriensis]|uniref:histidine kinase n=1 Tax=Aliarcobacter vitoriensis TaxID=2011099 RepID=A0A366MUG1_9BACT|nr:cache domain-containing protein [Aliarcobacter vitoriensis]RBQ29032.1 histidine kinase [Aliarcobacter vitoriensis]